MKEQHLDNSVTIMECRQHNSPAIFRALALFLLLLSCNGEHVPDCFQKTGDAVREELSLPAFDKITVYENVSLVLTQGDTQKVVLETGSNLRPEISAKVVDGRLEVRDENNCNLFRDYGTTTVYVTSPDLTEIRSSTGFPIRSEGVLRYSRLILQSESFSNPGSETTDGSFNLVLEAQSVTVVANGIAYFRLSGTTGSLQLNIGAGDSRIEANALLAGMVTINHRGSNDMLVSPLQSLKGVIRGTGDVLSYGRPDTVEVVQLYKGRLLFVQ